MKVERGDVFLASLSPNTIFERSEIFYEQQNVY